MSGVSEIAQRLTAVSLAERSPRHDEPPRAAQRGDLRVAGRATEQLVELDQQVALELESRGAGRQVALGEACPVSRGLVFDRHRQRKEVRPEAPAQIREVAVVG